MKFSFRNKIIIIKNYYILDYNTEKCKSSFKTNIIEKKQKKCMLSKQSDDVCCVDDVANGVF